MKRLYREAGIDAGNGIIVNHSGRVTCWTRLFNDRFDQQMIIGYPSNTVRL